MASAGAGKRTQYNLFQRYGVIEPRQRDEKTITLMNRGGRADEISIGDGF